MTIEQNLIGGQWRATPDLLDVFNPADGVLLGKVPKSGVPEAEAALAAASRAFPAWVAAQSLHPHRTPAQAAELVAAEAESIARLMTQEQGKPLAEALGEVRKGAEILRFYAEEGERVHGKIVPNADAGVESRVVYEPLGVAVAISPWNYPIELLAWKVGAALAAGCTIVCKLPVETPFSPIAFIRCVEKAGVPAGVVNCLTDPGPCSAPSSSAAPLVKKVAFTGSTAVGRKIVQYAAESSTFKKVSVELGGSLPMIVCRRRRPRAGSEGRGPPLVPQHGTNLHRDQPHLYRRADL